LAAEPVHQNVLLNYVGAPNRYGLPAFYEPIDSITEVPVTLLPK
jgi:hypothetical protein